MNYTGEYEFEYDDYHDAYSARLTSGCETLIFPSEYNGHKVFSIWADEDGAKHRLSVKSAHVPEGILYLECNLFECFSSLEEVTISSTVKYIDPRVFASCPSLKKVKVHPQNKHFRTIDGNLYSKDKRTLIYVAGANAKTNFEVPDFVEVIGDSAFAYSAIENLILPENVVEIQKNAFFACRNLTQVLLPSSLTKINDFAFAYCVALEGIFVPNSVEIMGYNIFHECNKNAQIFCETKERKSTWDKNWAKDVKIIWNCIH